MSTGPQTNSGAQSHASMPPVQTNQNGISAAKRSRFATVHAGGHAKYPIFNQSSARSALRLIGNAKPPLSSSQEADVRRRAAKYLGHGAGN